MPSTPWGATTTRTRSHLGSAGVAAFLAALSMTVCATPAAMSAAPRADACTGSYAVCKEAALVAVPSYKPDGWTPIWPNADATVEAIVDDAASRSQAQAIAGGVQKDGRDTVRTILDGSYFYITANTYGVISKAALKAWTKPTAKDRGYCEFYIYDSNLKFVSSRIAKVGVGPRLTMCNDVAGVTGVAFHGKPALMAIVQYFYTGGPVTSSAADLGSTWIRTTVLLPLEKDAAGKWTFMQDTTCFPLTNQIKTLAQARRYLDTNCRWIRKLTCT